MAGEHIRERVKIEEAEEEAGQAPRMMDGADPDPTVSNASGTLEDSVDHQSEGVIGEDVQTGGELDPDLEDLDMNGSATQEEVKVLEATVEGHENTLGRMVEVDEDNEGKFQKDWREVQERARLGLKEELVKVTKEEELLLEMVDTLKKTLCHETTGLGLKLEEFRKLTIKVDELKYGKVQKPVPLKQLVEITGEGVAGRKDAVAILPEEMWKMILGNVSDPKNLWNLTNTCQHFDTILSPWKTGWMLEQALPYLYQHLPGKKLLESRLVCKSWKGAVDHFLEEHPSVRPHDPEKHEPRRLDFVNPMREKFLDSYELRIDNNTDISLVEDPVFIEEWKQIHVIGRCFTLTLSAQTADGGFDDIAEEFRRDDDYVKQWFLEMWEKFVAFLNGFGKEVLYLNVRVNLFANTDGDPWQEKVRHFFTLDLFRLFPELRVLRVWSTDCDLRAIRPESLAPAPKLETLESDGFGGDLAMLSRYHTQLRSINVMVETWKEVNHLNWPNLTELRLNGFGEVEDFENLIDELRVPQLTKLGMNLIDFIDIGFPDPIEFQVLFGFIRQVSASTPLSSLRLEGGLHGFHIGQASKGSSYTLAKIKTLEFHHHTNDGLAVTYDFLLHFFPLLENLNVFARCNVDTETDPFYYTDFGLVPRKCRGLKRRWLQSGKGPEIVEVNKYMYDGQMYKSNIWELMPHLKVFSFQWDVYTRHEYEAYKEKLKGTME